MIDNNVRPDKAALWAYAQSIGMEMLGVASIDRFDGVEAQRHPVSILPEAKAVIVVGVSIPRGSYQGIEQGTLWMGVEQRLNIQPLLQLCRFMERDGYEAVPVHTNTAKFMPKGPVGEGCQPGSGRPVPNVRPSIAYAAVAAGLGEIGYHGLVMTPAFGPRQTLGMIITDAPYEADPIFAGTVCDRCKKCAVICPSRAISMESAARVTICGKEMELADINSELCRLCENGAFADYSYQIGVEELMSGISKQPVRRGNMPNIQRALCNRTCIAHLDECGRQPGSGCQPGLGGLDRGHVNPFRTEEPWVLEYWERG